MKSDEIRTSFLKFFESKGHRIVPSSSLLPNAPNLLFTNAGMNPFVPYFLGERKPIDKRVADTQKCVRAGGKHNDLEEVGLDTYHHTFFEMLGNWSFGDYFKEASIQWAWELLTQVWGIPKSRLYATVYKPAAGEPADFDEEAYQIWRKIFIAEGMNADTHIVFGNKKDNFWMMGDTGPCGPCSEIHMDLTLEGNSEGRLVNQGDGRCIEVWNLVFMQYNALSNDKFDYLPNKFVDTGMGFERIAGIFASTHNLEDFSRVPSNYDSDLFSPIFEQLEQWSGHSYRGLVAQDSHAPDDQLAKDIAFRTIADHIRTLTFAISDGILPGNEGRNYVLRRIVRRAILAGQKLGLQGEFLSKLSEIVIKRMGGFFKDLIPCEETVKNVLSKEEKTFQITLQHGLQLFNQWANETTRCLSGQQAFLLYDTYGFPIDLTQLIAKERGIKVDIETFNTLLEDQKKRSKSAAKKTLIKLQSVGDQKTEFVGYEAANCQNCTATLLDCVQDGQGTYIVTDITPFYAQKGGQVGDRGWAYFEDGSKAEITDTFYQDQIILHKVNLSPLQLKAFLKSKVRLEVNLARRRQISNHHTATHILHWALRKVLGNHVKQAGSCVQEDQLRFDFSHFEKLDTKTLSIIESLCCQKILENLPVQTNEVPFNERPSDCLAFFEDKYGDVVRIVKTGDCGSELCGGTHAQRTGDLGLLKIRQESAVASGIRRIEAVVGESALQYINNNLQAIRDLEEKIACPLDKIYERMQVLQRQKTDLEKQYHQILQKNVDNNVVESIELSGLICARFDIQNTDMNTLKGCSKQYFVDHKIDILLSFCVLDAKANVIVFCSDKAIAQGYLASKVIKSFLQHLVANGGGKADFASGGVKDARVLIDYLKDFSLKQFLLTVETH